MEKWSRYGVGLGLVFGAAIGSLFGEVGQGAAYGLIIGAILYGWSRRGKKG